MPPSLPAGLSEEAARAGLSATKECLPPSPKRVARGEDSVAPAVATDATQGDGDWARLNWSGGIYIASHTLAASVLGFNATHFPPSGSVNATTGALRQALNDVGGQTVFGVACVGFAALAQEVGTRAYAAQGKTPPGGPPDWGELAKSSVAYVVAGPLARIPTGMIYHLFPPSGTLLAATGARAVLNNFCFGALGGLTFVGVFFLTRAAIQYCVSRWGPHRGDETSSEPTQAPSGGDDPGRFVPAFVLGVGAQAVVLPWIAAGLPQSGMPGAGTGPVQPGQDVLSEFLIMLASFVGSSVPAEALAQLRRRRRRAHTSASDQPGPATAAGEGRRRVERHCARRHGCKGYGHQPRWYVHVKRPRARRPGAR